MPKNEKQYLGFTAPFDLAEWLRRKAEAEQRSVSNTINFVLEKARREEEASARA